MEMREVTGKCVYDRDLAAENLVGFLQEVPTLACGIGDIKKDKYSNSGELVSVGVEINSSKNPSYFLAGLNSMIELNKLDKVMGEDADSLINYYYSKNTAWSNEKEAIRDKLMNLRKNREVVTAFNVGEVIGASPEIAQKVYGVKNLTVSGCLWKMNLQRNRFESFVILTHDKRAGIRVPLEEYGDSFILKKLEGAEGKETIKASRFGYIKPLKVTDGKNMYALDGKYIYKVMKGSIEVVGTLSASGINLFDAKEFRANSKVGKFIKESYAYYCKHLKYIPPFGMVGENVVEV